MTAKRTPSRRAPMRAPAPKQKISFWEANAKKVTLAAVGIGAAVALANYASLVLNSHLPTASQIDVDGVRKDLSTDIHNHAEALTKAIDETLAVAKAANTAAQQSIQTTNDFHVDRLLQQKISIEDQLKKSPDDASLKAALARTLIDIAKATNMPAAPPMP